MDINVFNQILETLTSVGIEEVVFDPKEDNVTLIRGSNKEMNVIVFHSVEENLMEDVMAIQTVKGLLARIQLFEPAKATYNLDTKDGRVVDFVIKQGRKKASFKCASSDSLAVPKRVPGDLSFVNSIEFSKEDVERIALATSAMSYTGVKAERCIMIGVSNNVATFSIFDGEDDTFTEEIDVTFPDTKRVSWEVAPFLRVMRQSVEKTGSCKFTITEHGIAVFDLGGINILVAPVSR